jgi:hypothetical protein
LMAALKILCEFEDVEVPFELTLRPGDLDGPEDIEPALSDFAWDIFCLLEFTLVRCCSQGCSRGLVCSFCRGSVACGLPFGRDSVRQCECVGFAGCDSFRGEGARWGRLPLGGDGDRIFRARGGGDRTEGVPFA